MLPIEYRDPQHHDARLHHDASREEAEWLLTERLSRRYAAEPEAGVEERVLTDELERLPPGPFLAAMLRTIDLQQCSGPDRVRVLAARQRMASHYQARVYEDIAAVAEHMEVLDGGDIELAVTGTAAEVRAALRLTRRCADNEVGLALEFRNRLPDVWAALAAGRIDLRRARTIVHATGHLAPADARHAASAVLDDAENLTSGQLAARLKRVCIEINPNDAAERYDRSVSRRMFYVEANPDGSAHVGVADVHADRAAAASDYVNRCARTLRAAGENRTMDQLRADVALDLLAGKTGIGAAGAKGSVTLTVELGTLAELNESPGELSGYGPVVAEVARKVAREHGDAQWRYRVADQGQVVATGTTRRRPSAPIRRFVEDRDITCVFPGCRMPAVECDLDHRVDWVDGGSTTTANLGPLCRHDHRNKHQLGWTYRRLGDGTYRWTSKLGHVYTTSKPP